MPVISFPVYSIGKITSFDFKYPIFKLQVADLFNDYLKEASIKREINIAIVSSIFGFFARLNTNLITPQMWKFSFDFLQNCEEEERRVYTTQEPILVS